MDIRTWAAIGVATVVASVMTHYAPTWYHWFALLSGTTAGFAAFYYREIFFGARTAVQEWWTGVSWEGTIAAVRGWLKNPHPFAYLAGGIFALTFAVFVATTKVWPISVYAIFAFFFFALATVVSLAVAILARIGAVWWSQVYWPSEGFAAPKDYDILSAPLCTEVPISYRAYLWAAQGIVVVLLLWPWTIIYGIGYAVGLLGYHSLRVLHMSRFVLSLIYATAGWFASNAYISHVSGVATPNAQRLYIIAAGISAGVILGLLHFQVISKRVFGIGTLSE